MLTCEELTRAYLVLTSLTGELPIENPTDAQLTAAFNEIVNSRLSKQIRDGPTNPEIIMTFRVALDTLKDDELYHTSNGGPIEGDVHRYPGIGGPGWHSDFPEELMTGKQLKLMIRNYYSNSKWDFSPARGDVYKSYNQVKHALRSGVIVY